MATEPDTNSGGGGLILVGYDGSAGSEDALRWAIAEAAARQCGLTVLQGWHDPVFSHRTWTERWNDPGFEEHEAAAALERIVAEAVADQPTVAATSRLVTSHPADALVEAAADHELVVVGSRGHGGFAALTLGSVAERVAAASPVSVVVVRGEVPDDGDIVVGVDGSVGSRRALLWAVDEGRIRSRAVRSVLAWTARIPVAARGAQPFGAAAKDEDADLALHRTIVEQVGTSAAQEIGRQTACAPAASAVLDAAAGAQMVVVGSPPATGDGHEHLGAVARQVLRHAPCPVVVAR